MSHAARAAGSPGMSGSGGGLEKRKSQTQGQVVSECTGRVAVRHVAVT